MAHEGRTARPLAASESAPRNDQDKRSPMPRYFFHLWNGGQLAPDETGCALPGPDAARRKAEAMIARLTVQTPFAPEDWSGCDIEVTDDAGQTVTLLSVADARLSPVGKRAA